MSGVVAFFVVSGATTNFLEVQKQLRYDGSQVSDEPQNKGRLPGNMQRAIDRSNADLQLKFDTVQASVNAHTMRSSQIMSGVRGKNRLLTKSPTVTKRKEPKRSRRNVQKGAVESNPFLD